MTYAVFIWSAYGATVVALGFTLLFITLWLMRMRSALMAAKLRALRLQQAA